MSGACWMLAEGSLVIVAGGASDGTMGRIGFANTTII